jgi:hypothetical protein
VGGYSYGEGSDALAVEAGGDMSARAAEEGIEIEDGEGVTHLGFPGVKLDDTKETSKTLHVGSSDVLVRFFNTTCS